MKTRREFIKISTIGAGITAVGLKVFGSGILSWLDSDTEKPVSDEDLTPYPTYCEMCFWKCAGWVYVDKSGRIRKIMGIKKICTAMGGCVREVQVA